jgi:hypothetical protein
MGWPRLGQAEVDAIVQLGDGPMSADLVDQVGLLVGMSKAETRADALDRVVLLNWPGVNPAGGALLRRLGFAPIYATLCMYRGAQPQVSLADVYGLACLELG